MKYNLAAHMLLMESGIDASLHKIGWEDVSTISSASVLVQNNTCWETENLQMGEVLRKKEK